MKNKSGFNYRTLITALVCVAVAFLVWLLAKVAG